MSDLTQKQQEAFLNLLRQKFFSKDCVEKIISLKKGALHGDTITYKDNAFEISFVEHPFHSGYPSSHYLWIEITNISENISEKFSITEPELYKFSDIIKRYKELVKEKEVFDIKSNKSRLDNLFNM